MMRRWTSVALRTVFTTPRRAIGHRQYGPQGLREAAARVPTTPEFAEECNKLAKTAHSTRNFGDAIALYDRCLIVRREVLGPIHVKCAAVLHNIGRVFMDMREYGAAENALTEAAAIYEKLEGTRSLRYAESLALLAHCYVHLKFLPEAEKGFKEALEVYRDVVYSHRDQSWIPAGTPPPTTDPNVHPLAAVAHCLADCAHMCLLRDMEARARTMLEDALEIRRYLYTKHIKYRPMIAQTLTKLAELKRSANDIALAEMYAKEAVDICIECLGRDSPATAAAISTQGTLLATKKKFKDALRCFDEATTTYAMSLGKDNAIVGTELSKAGRMHEGLEDYRAAERCYRRAREIMVTATGAQSLNVADVNACLANLLLRMMGFEEAITLLKEAIAIRHKADPKDPQIAPLLHKLGDAYGMQGDGLAEGFLLQSCEAYIRNAEKEATQKALLTDVYDDLALFYMERQQLPACGEYLKKALDIRLELLGDSHPTVGYSYSNFAMLYLREKKLKECEEMAKAAMDVYTRAAHQQPLAHADVFTTRGQCAHALEKNDDALVWHRKALDIRRMRGDQYDVATAESHCNISRVLVSKKDYPLAAAHLSEAKKLAAKHGSLTSRLMAEVEAIEKTIPISLTDPSVKSIVV